MRFSPRPKLSTRAHGSRRAAAFLLPALFAVFATTAAQAATPTTAQFVTLLDLDNNASTGCTVATASGPFKGVERELTTTVDLTQSPPAVISVTQQICNAGSFGAATPVNSPYAPPWPVGVGNGFDGAEVVETYLPLSDISLGTTIHLGFTSQIVGGTAADATLTTTGQAGGPPILLSAQPLAAVPTLGTLGLLVLGLLLAVAALRLLGRRGPNGTSGTTKSLVAGLLLLTLGFGMAWAAGDLTPNGTVTGWAGISPIATDPAGDAPPNVDMVAQYAVIQNNILYVRIDANIPGQPQVTQVTPANGAVNVSGTAPLTVTFNEPVTITASTFSLACPTGTPETFTVSPAVPGNAATYTLTPTSALPAGVTCTLTVAADQVTDAALLHPTADFTSTFTTDGPPTVTSTTPANGATTVALNTTVTVNFSKPVNVTATAFSLQCPTGTPETFTVAPTPPGGASTFTLTPSATLPATTTCTLTVSASQVTDVAEGTPMATDFTASFTTDTIPTVTSTTPANGATLVALNGPISITFSQPVNVTATAFKLECPTGTSEPFTVAPAPPGGATTYTLTPTANLPANTTCTVTVVASQVKDVAAATPLASNFVFSFTTDTIPTVTSTTPATGAINQAPSTTITINFSTTMNVTASAFKLECPVGTPEAFTVAPAPPGGVTSFTLTPSANLPVSTTCTVTVVANQVGDTAAGTPLASNYVFTFTVGNPPSVTSTVPATGATAVLATAPISLTFSKAVNVTATAFKLECPVGTPEAFTVSPTPPGGVTTFTLTPSAALPAGVTCTVTAVAAQITDTVAGLHPSADYVFTFTVDSPPSVTANTPTTGATSVALNTTVTFTFNKAVNITNPAFKLECPVGTPEAFTVSPAAPGNAATFTLTPSANLPAGVTCTATAVATQIKDASGTPLTTNYVFTFTTDTAPTVSSTTPAAAATSVALNTTVVFTFSKAVNVTATAFTLQCPSGTPVGFTLAPAPPGNATTFTLTPSANLPAGTACVATAVANQISDAVGTNLASNFTLNFTTDVAPTVTATTPANGATLVNPSTTVSLTFSKAVNITNPAFKLECPVGTPQAFTVAPAAPGGATTFTLTPSAALPPATTCTVTATAAQIADVAAGTHLASDFVFTFTTASPPTVTATTPGNGATGVLASSALSITFNKAVNVTGTAFTLQCPTGTPETLTIAPTPPGGVATYTLTPTAALPAGTVCTATAVASQITDAASGTNLAANYVWNFTTDTPPTVSSTNPTNGATSTALNSTVVFTFSKAVNVTATAFTLQCPTGTPEAFTLSPSPPGAVTTFTLTPSANLPAGTVCTATAVAAQITDLAGTHLAANVSTSFTTDTVPAVTSTSPAAAATSVALNATVSFTFNKAVNVTPSAFTLQCPSGTPVAFALAPAPPGNATTFTLTPSANLPAGTACVATAVASQITDSVGTNPASNFTLNFTTDVAPTVTATTPANGATLVSPATTVSFTFSKAVNITNPAFKLECPVGTPQAFTVAPAAPGGATTFTLTPSANLPVSTTCTATATATQIADVAAGTHLAADFVFTFTTAAPPTVTSTTPANGATAVLATSPLSITFNKAVNVTATAFTLQCPTGTPESLTISPTPPGGVATFTLTPSAALPAGTVCTATAVASQITDAASGVNLAANYVWSFTTDTPPTVSSTNPTNGATATALNTTVTFTFSKAVNVTASAFTLQCPTGTPEAFTLSPAPPGGATTFTLTPTANLPAGTVCTATAVASQISDLAGTPLAANVPTSFTTDTAPSVSSVSPANGATGVLKGATLTVNFNKAVNVTGTAFSLACPTGTPIGLTVSPTPPGGVTSFTLTPTSNLPGGAVCTATVTANQVTDTTAGTAMAANFTWSFTVDTPPTVTSTVPANGTSNFVDTGALSFTFNKAVDITATAFGIQCPVGTPVTFTVSPAAPGGVTAFTLTPSTNLPPNVTCSATASASQITDVAGTNMAADFTITFATVPPPPVATNDTYPQTLIGNLSVNSALIPYSVTTNDTSQVAFTITAYDSTSANGGTVVMTTSGVNMGQFSYNPAAGFRGTDTFTYTITNTGGSATGTVSITVANMVWFINNNATSGDGRIATPLNSLAAFAAINDGVGRHPQANDDIFLYDSATGYTGPVTLLNGQKLVGQDATSSLSVITGLTPPSSSSTFPATAGGSPNKVQITASGNTVTLGSGNTVWGLTLGNATGTALTGGSVGSLKLRDMTIDNTSGAAASLSNGALDAILNAVTAGGGTHGLALTTTTGSFDVEGGGASDPANTTRGRTTARSGGGTITLGSGGTIQNATSSGVLLSGATSVTLRNMVIQNNGGAGVNSGGHGIDASGTNGLTLDNDLITGQTGNSGLFASTLATLAIQHTQISSNATNAGDVAPEVSNVQFGLPLCAATCANGLTGTSTVANSIFDTAAEDTFTLANFNTAALTLTITNSQFSHAGNDGLLSQAFDSANVSLSVDGSSVHNNADGGVMYDGNETSGGGTIAVTNSTFDQNDVDVNIAHEGAGKTITFNISGNTTRQTFVTNSAISLGVDIGGTATATTIAQGTIENNVVGLASVTDSGSALSSGIGLQTSGPGTITALISGNSVVQTDDDGLLVLASSPTTSTINVTATNNSFSVSPTDINTNLGLELTSGGDAGTDVVCANISGNVKEIGNSGVAGIATEVFTGANIELQGYPGAANNNTAIAAFLNGTAATVSPAALNFGGGGTVKAAPVPCPTPP